MKGGGGGGGSVEKMRIMWHRREIVLAGLPSLLRKAQDFTISDIQKN